MKESNKLFELIKSLTATEKGYFKKYTLIHAQSYEQGYIKLFDAFASGDEYDEEKIKKALKNSKSLKHFSYSQNYLYKLVLKSLRSYHSEKTVFSSTLGLLMDSFLLSSKGLIEESEKALQNSIEIAGKRDESFLILKALQLMQKNNLKKPDINKIEHYIKKWYPLVFNLIDSERKLTEIDQLNDEIYVLSLKFGMNSRNKAVTDEALKILEHPLLKEDLRYGSRKAIYKILDAKNVLYSILGDYKAYFDNNEQYIRALKSDPLFNKDATLVRNYLVVLGNKIASITHLKMIDEFERICKKVKLLRLETSDQEITLLGLIYSNILFGFIVFGTPYKALEYISEINKKIRRYEGKIAEGHLAILQLNLACLYFMMEDYRNVYKLVNKIEKVLHKNMRLDVQLNLKILTILLHYENKNYQLVDSLIVSFRRFISRIGNVSVFLKITIKNIKNLNFLNDKKDVQEKLTLFRNELTDAAKKEKDEYAYILFWIEKKLKALKENSGV